VKSLIKILLIGSVLFMGIGILQNWRNFFRVGPANAPQRGDPEVEAAVSNTVHQFISIARHAYQSGGDMRFAERLPASEPVIAELMDEIAYLNKNGRVQMSRLARFEILDVELVAANRAVVRTAEDWVVYTANAADGERFDEDRVHSVFAEYRLARRGPGWQVVQWDLVAPPPPPDAAPEPARP